MKILIGVSLLVLLQLSECYPFQSMYSAQAVELKYNCMEQKYGPEYDKLSPIILLHGLGATKESWNGFYGSLAFETKRKICMPDLRNHGESPYSREADVEAMAADIVKMINKLKADKVILLGHSLGGKVAVHVALKHPQKVEKLIIEDMRPNGVTPEVLKYIKQFMQLVQQAVAQIPAGLTEHDAKEFFVEYMKETMEQMGINSDLDFNETDRIPIRCIDGKCNFQVNIKLFSEVIKDPERFLTQSKGQYLGPALFIYGTKSPFKVGEDEDNIRKLFPKAKLVPVEGAGHIIHLKHKIFWQETLKFITSDS